jgi:hypothetical protein
VWVVQAMSAATMLPPKRIVYYLLCEKCEAEIRFFEGPDELLLADQKGKVVFSGIRFGPEEAGFVERHQAHELRAARAKDE